MIFTKARILSHGMDEGIYFIRIANDKIKIISKEMDTIDDILVNPYIAMKAALGENPKRVHNLTRMGLISKLREFLRISKEYNLDKEAKYDHQLEAMKSVMNREVPLKIHVHRADDIVSAIKVVEEFDLLYTLDHVTCGADILDYIHTKKRNLIVGPSLGARGKMELKGKGFENLVKLAEDQDISIITDAPVIPLQYLPICVGLAISKGLSFKRD